MFKRFVKDSPLLKIHHPLKQYIISKSKRPISVAERNPKKEKKEH